MTFSSLRCFERGTSFYYRGKGSNPYTCHMRCALKFDIAYSENNRNAFHGETDSTAANVNDARRACKTPWASVFWIILLSGY